MKRNRPGSYAPLPVDFFRHPKTHLAAATDDKAPEVFLVLVAAAQEKVPRDEVKITWRDLASWSRIAPEQARISRLISVLEAVGWLRVRDQDSVGLHGFLPNQAEWNGEEPNSADKSNEPTEIVRVVFDYWREKCGHDGARLTSDRRTKIGARVKEGYGVEQLKRAIDGCAGSDWHMGRDSKTEGRRYDELSRIMGNGEQVEKVMAMPLPRARGLAALDALER
jgi:uncharacterized phage protein (TIGR02220 family)